MVAKRRLLSIIATLRVGNATILRIIVLTVLKIDDDQFLKQKIKVKGKPL